MRRWSFVGLLLVAIVTVACGSANSPTSPGSPAAGSVQGVLDSASADPTLKATAPTIVQPKDRVRVDALRPVLEWQNAKGKFIDAPFTYQVEVYEGNTLIETWPVPQGGGGRTTLTIPWDLKHDTLYRWRVRAQFSNAFTAFDTTADFLSPLPPWTPGQPYGPTRTMSVEEALSIIEAYHDSIGADLGSRSTRETRVAFWWAAVANVHYGHPVHNPAGGDRGWCVKDAGGGRPPSDDVLVRCATRDWWDMVAGIEHDGYTFQTTGYGGILPGEQNVYPPPLSSLPK